MMLIFEKEFDLIFKYLQKVVKFALGAINNDFVFLDFPPITFFGE